MPAGTPCSSPPRGLGQFSVDELDVLMMRNDPANDATSRPWAASAGGPFGRLAKRRGVSPLRRRLRGVLPKLFVEVRGTLGCDAN